MVAANGARFHVAVAGEGPLVLFLHGFPEFWWAWRHQLVSLAEAGYQAAAMDLRGFGASDKPPRGYDPMTLAADAAGVIRSLGERDAVVVGHGLGGAVAWTAGVVHPRQVRRLVPVSMPHPRRLRRAHLTDPRQLAASRQLAGYQAPFAPERRLRRRRRARGAATAACLVGTRLAGRRGCHPLLRGDPHPGRRQLRDGALPLGCPLGAAPRRPPLCPADEQPGDRADPAGAWRARPRVPPRSAQGSDRYVEADYHWRLMPGVGHFPHEEDPATFTRVLLEWLGDVSVDQ